jgi:hypothetical protein
MRGPLVSVAAIVAVVAGGCSGTSAPPASQTSVGSTSTTTVVATPQSPTYGSPPVLSIVVPDCPSEAQCARGFTLGGEPWQVGCLLLDPDSVTDDVVAVGEGDSFIDEVRTIEGTDARVMAAAHVPERLNCPGNPGGDVSGWVAAVGPVDSFGSEKAATDLARAICDHGVNPAEADRCDRGGNIVWVADDGVFHYGYFPEYQEQVGAQLSVGDGPHWRLDAEATAAEHWMDRHNLCTNLDDSWLSTCRAGFGESIVEGSITRVPVTMQWAADAGYGMLYNTSFEVINLEQHDSTWWVVSWREGPDASGVGEEDQEAFDRLWDDSCCEQLLVDTSSATP